MIRLALTATLIAAPVPAQAQAQAPTGAAIDPARLVAAEKVVAALVPQGIYARIMRDQFPRMMDMMMARMSGMSPADIGEAGDGTLGDKMRAQDPHLEERTRIMNKVMGEELATLFGTLEPRVRAGMSRAYARKFTAAQLADMQRFFATPSGTAFANEYIALFADPELVGEMAAAAPQMMRAMPAIMKKVQAATAHLPPPPKKTGDTK